MEARMEAPDGDRRPQTQADALFVFDPIAVKEHA
jgi:hypothetical protein